MINFLSQLSGDFIFNDCDDCFELKELDNVVRHWEDDNGEDVALSVHDTPLADIEQIMKYEDIIRGSYLWSRLVPFTKMLDGDWSLL